MVNNQITKHSPGNIVQQTCLLLNFPSDAQLHRVAGSPRLREAFEENATYLGGSAKPVQRSSARNGTRFGYAVKGIARSSPVTGRIRSEARLLSRGANLYFNLVRSAPNVISKRKPAQECGLGRVVNPNQLGLETNMKLAGKHVRL